MPTAHSPCSTITPCVRSLLAEQSLCQTKTAAAKCLKQKNKNNNKKKSLSMITCSIQPG
uniref:Uncharacterized protein n=1 Tax=Anguilla anguilla TaxID=7936 RepID=A0A0E9WWP4_ANGAN